MKNNKIKKRNVILHHDAREECSGKMTLKDDMI